ncbi:HlyD family secretion protein [Pseudobythopirellula maris]|uniref:HlyD family secretion protein n=1 Tax=Pseudobythopirellula maris TaxID=2527991 RepID=A0A5C5ZUK8_9BACT|nr:biotin/lipoyl-binding protein [Pseudobythopirellula maris]TWT90896.1 HlyD family secretion protein [Pseudobythopirellula maris]
MSTSDYTNQPDASSSTASVDADAVQRAKREITGIVQQISEMSRDDISPEVYYDKFLNKVVSALAAPGGAVWTLSDTGAFQLTYQINLRETGLAQNPIGQAQHGRLLQQVLKGDEGTIISPHSGAAGGLDTEDENAAANPTDFLLVLAPVHNDEGPQGVVEVFQRPGGRSQVQRGYLRFLQQTCDLAGDYLRGRRLRHLADKQTLWEQLEAFTRTAHEKLDTRETAYSIANEGRRLIGADRVTVAVKRGGRVRIDAVSGMDVPDSRSNVMTMLTKVARAVAKTGEEVWYTGDTSDLAPQVERTLEAYVDESHTKAMAILPLTRGDGDVDPTPDDPESRRHKPPEVIGVLIVEQMVDATPPEGFSQRVDVVRSHSSTALSNALEHESLFLMPLWKALGKSTWMFRARTLPKTILITAAIVGAIVASLVVPRDFALEGDGKLRPLEMHNVFAKTSGDVVAVYAEHEQQVIEGQTLVELRSLDLEQEQTALRGKISETQSEWHSLDRETLSGRGVNASERNQKSSRITQLTEQLNNLRIQQGVLDEKQRQLTVKSPIAGKVITWKVDEQLRGRPVTQGQVLMEVANPEGEWILEISMPDKRMGHITQALSESGGELPVSFLLATTTETPLEGVLHAKGVAATAEVRGEEGNTVLLTVEFDQEKFRSLIANPKVGAEVKAKVHCGQRPLAYVYLHDLIDFIRSKILFRL